MTDLRTRLGPVDLRSPLIAASGTVGAVVDLAGIVPFEFYGAAVAKSVSGEAWQGLPPPRLAPTGTGMLNAVGVQNPGIEAWVERYGPHIRGAGVPVWGSVIGTTVDEFSMVAKGLATVEVQAIELNLSCPNLETGVPFALQEDRAAEVVAAVRSTVDLPLGAKLSPNASDVVAVAAAVADAGADWVVLTNTVWGAAFDYKTRRPLLSTTVGGYSGPPLKPIALRCVYEVSRALPDLPIVGCGGVRSWEDAAEYMVAGAAAVAVGTAHFENPKIGRGIVRGLMSYCRRQGLSTLSDLGVSA